jgi:hypothetical protein
MSEQRRYRAELRQGLHQFLMQMYSTYLESHSEEDAKKIVSEILAEQVTFFGGVGSIDSAPLQDVIQSKIKEFDTKLRASSDYDEQMYYTDQIDVLSRAIAILK